MLNLSNNRHGKYLMFIWINFIHAKIYILVGNVLNAADRDKKNLVSLGWGQRRFTIVCMGNNMLINK